jgi:hypothetical protein
VQRLSRGNCKYRNILALQEAYSYRECSGVHDTAVNLIVFSGGAGDVEDYALESQGTLISVHCRNATMARNVLA